MHESRLLRALESKAMHYNQTSDNYIESEDEDKENMDAARNCTENNDYFPRDVHQNTETKNCNIMAEGFRFICPAFGFS